MTMNIVKHLDSLPRHVLQLSAMNCSVLDKTPRTRDMCVSHQINPSAVLSWTR